MQNTGTAIRNLFLHFLYTKILKPVFFLFDPELVHDRFIKLGSKLGKHKFFQSLTKALFFYKNKSLEQDILGIHFSNPIGLSAGFDKDAEIVDIIPSVGFGFVEVGSITGEPCAGNSGKRLWRLPKSKALVVYYGLKNKGAKILSKKLHNRNFKIPVGISIAKTNSPDTCQLDSGINDYAKAFESFVDIGDYITVNISCPNVFGGEPFTHPDRLEKLLEKLDSIKYDKPVFIKLAADLSDTELQDIIDVAGRYRVQGFVCTNLSKNRNNDSIKSKIKEDNIPEKGGISGKVVEDLSDDTIQRVYKYTRGAYVIIGVGGVFSAEDAYKKIKFGASLIQLITGMIFEGPQLISEINRGLVELLEKDGYKNISESIGVDISLD